MKASTLHFGMTGESRAADYLKNMGYAILCRNWRFGRLELDIVSEIDSQIVFVEVKTRRQRSFGGAIMAITPKKCLNMARAAQAWLKEQDLWERSCRFDIICLTGKMPTPVIEHFPNAFDLAWFMDSGHSSW